MNLDTSKWQQRTQNKVYVIDLQLIVQNIHSIDGTITVCHSSSLGARHDGSNGCPSNTLHLMTHFTEEHSADTIDNAYLFSVCSTNEMLLLITGSQDYDLSATDW